MFYQCKCSIVCRAIEFCECGLAADVIEFSFALFFVYLIYLFRLLFNTAEDVFLVLSYEIISFFVLSVLIVDLLLLLLFVSLFIFTRKST